jgi:hypothetical protein
MDQKIQSKRHTARTVLITFFATLLFVIIGFLILRPVGVKTGSAPLGEKEGKMQTTSLSYQLNPINENWPNLVRSVRIVKFFKNKSSSSSFQDSVDNLKKLLMGQLPNVTVNGERFWIIDGDDLLDGDQLEEYCQRKISLEDSNYKHYNLTGLTVVTDSDNNVIIWPKDSVIKYSILKRSFTSTAHYTLIVNRLQQAASDWMKICGVKFQYMPQYDDLPASSALPDGLTFFAKEYPIGGAIATSFFPFYPSERCRLLIHPVAYYNSPYDGVGALRHELGHIIGCRHEQIWSSDPTCTRGEEVIVKNYLGQTMGAKLIGDIPDPFSVMHYKCGNSGSYSLQFTPSDIRSAMTLFGHPR